MNNRIVIACVAVILSGLSVAGQVPTEAPDYEKPVERQWDDGNCHRLQVENLYKATNPNDPLQEGYLKSAEAYEKLIEEGQSC